MTEGTYAVKGMPDYYDSAPGSFTVDVDGHGHYALRAGSATARTFAEGVNMRRREKFRNSQCKSLD